MTYVQRADRLRALTGLEWTAAENFHSATDGKHRYTLKRISGLADAWIATIDTEERVQTWDAVVGWLLKQLEMEAV